MSRGPRHTVASFAVILAGAAVSGAQEPRVWQVTAGTATVVCALTVGGSFEAKSSALAGRVTADPAQPGRYQGAIAVDLRTLDTGIGFRNQHMRERYLEVQKGDGFDHAQLSDIRLEGVDPATGLGKAHFDGSFLVHGEKRAVRGEAEVRGDGDGIRVEATFPLAMSDFGIAKTEYLGVGVKDSVRVKVDLRASKAREAASATAAAAP